MHTPMTSSIRGACSKALPPLPHDNEAGSLSLVVDCMQGGCLARVLDSKAMVHRKHVSMSYCPPLHSAPCISHDRFFCTLHSDMLLHWFVLGHRRGKVLSPSVPLALHGRLNRSPLLCLLPGLPCFQLPLSFPLWETTGEAQQVPPIA